MNDDTPLSRVVAALRQVIDALGLIELPRQPSPLMRRYRAKRRFR